MVDSLTGAAGHHHWPRSWISG